MTTKPSAASKQPRIFQKAPFSLFVDGCQALELSPTDLSRELGYSEYASSSWKAAGEMPLPAAIALQGLVELRRLKLQSEVAVAPRQAELAPPEFIVVAVDRGSDRDAVLAFCLAMNLEASVMAPRRK